MSAADRQRRFRERQRKGLLTSAVDYGNDVLRTLEYLKLLSERDFDDPEKVRAALSKFVAMAAPQFNPYL